MIRGVVTRSWWRRYQHRLLGLFGTLHGMVSVEINSHLAPRSVDGEALIVDRMTHALTVTRPGTGS